jgi:EAL domain-containing protein (putative c-di-GMP-specific phosphodiesterase class I)
MKAIDNKGFVLHYQPYFNIVTGEIKGAESLLRLQSDDLGLIMPARFIHVLEETGLIVKAGGWVLEEVIAQLGRWQQEGRARVPVTVNLSAVQFRTKDLGRRIRSSMQAAAVDPHLLSFEITESAFINDLDASIEAIDELKALGVNILIDDFGTAYSSLNYLSQFKVDVLKIDISFIRRMTTQKSDEAIVRAIITMAHSLNMKTIAEGVETEEQLQILRHLDCDMVQGFLFSKPIPPEDLAAKYLTRHC